MGAAVSRRLRLAGFDYADQSQRGYWATLRDGAGNTVIVTDYPRTLLSMLRAGVLEGEAQRDAVDELRFSRRVRLAEKG